MFSEIPYPHEYERILTPISSIVEAQTRIIADARQKVVDLPVWLDERLGLTPQIAGDTYDISFGIILRNAPIRLPLTIVSEDKSEEAPDVLVVPLDRRTELGGGYWLTMQEMTINPDTATFIRDYLWVKTPEIILARSKVPNDIRELAQASVLTRLLSLDAIRSAIDNVRSYI